ncbi:uncharacterized protein LOC144431304 [Styela clava]
MISLQAVILTVIFSKVTVSVQGEECWSAMICDDNPTWIKLPPKKQTSTTDEKMKNRMNKLEDDVQQTYNLLDGLNKTIQNLKRNANYTGQNTIPNATTNLTLNTTNSMEKSTQQPATEIERDTTYDSSTTKEYTSKEVTTLTTKTDGRSESDTTHDSLTTKEYTSEKSTSATTVSTTNVHRDNAEANQFYNNRVFIVMTDSKPNKVGAIEKCKNIGGKLANIYDNVHMKRIMEYIRSNKMRGRSEIYFLTGMTFDPIKEKLYLRDGTGIAVNDLLWWKGFPHKIADKTNMILRVNSDESRTDQYLNNQADSHRFFICEI